MRARGVGSSISPLPLEQIAQCRTPHGVERSRCGAHKYRLAHTRSPKARTYRGHRGEQRRTHPPNKRKSQQTAPRAERLFFIAWDRSSASAARTSRERGIFIIPYCQHFCQQEICINFCPRRSRFLCNFFAEMVLTFLVALVIMYLQGTEQYRACHFGVRQTTPNVRGERQTKGSASRLTGFAPKSTRHRSCEETAQI